MKLSRSFFAMSILLGVFIAPITFIPLVNAQGGQITLNPTDDAYTDSLYHGTNYDWAKLDVTLNTYERYAWLKFNLSDVPDGAIVTSATLELYCINLAAETYNVSAHFCLNNTWSELTITYDNQPNYDNRTAMSWVLVESPPDQWYSWDVAYAVKEKLDGIFGGEDVVTIVLQENRHHGQIVSFCSRESGYKQPPKLTVAWSGIIPEFPSWMPLLLVLIALTVAIVIYKRRLLKTPIR